MPLQNLFLPTRQTRNIDLFLDVCFWSDIQVTRLAAGEEDQIPMGVTLSNATVHGGPVFCRCVAAALGGSVVEPAPDFLPTLPREYVSRQIELTPLGQARLLTEPKFIKPVADKFFPAAVYDSGAHLSVEPGRDQESVLVSDPVEWEWEHRMFVLDNQVKTFSPYSPHGTVTATAEHGRKALEFGERVLADTRVHLPRAVVLDVGWIRGAGWAVVEANEAVMSGIYDCDPIAIPSPSWKCWSTGWRGMLKAGRNDPMTDIDTTWQRIDKWLSGNALEVMQGPRPGATEEQIAATAQTLGVVFPEDVRQSYRCHDGQGLDPMLGCAVGGGFVAGDDFLPLNGIVDQWKVWKDLLAVERAFGVSWDYNTLDEKPDEDEDEEMGQ